MESNIRIIPHHMIKLPALDLFRAGYNTADIAFCKKVHESTVCTWIFTARERERHGLASAYVSAG